MKQQTKLSQEQQQHAAAHLVGQHKEHEFASVEELLRFDGAHTDVPPEVAARLSLSARDIPPPPSPSRPWWKNLFGQ